MAIEIYQSNAGYLCVGDREVPLYNTQWVHSTNTGFDYITIINGDDVVIKNTPLRHIVDGNGGGYANLAAWTAWWNTLLTNNNRPYFVYTVFLNQTGTSAPIPTILEDSIGLPTWARTGVGTYTLTKTGFFTVGKSVPKKAEQYYDKDLNRFVLTPTSANLYTLETFAAIDDQTLADGVLVDQYINIEVYQ
jgi:hypothetical protein